MILPGTVQIQTLMEASGGSRELAMDLVRLYFELTGQELERMAEAVRSEDAATVSAIAHKCAGSSASCGIKKLAAMLRRLELDAAQAMPADISDRLTLIHRECTAAKAAFEEYFDCVFDS